MYFEYDVSFLFQHKFYLNKKFEAHDILFNSTQLDLVKEFDPMPSNILLILPPCEILRLLEP